MQLRKLFAPLFAALVLALAFTAAAPAEASANCTINVRAFYYPTTQLAGGYSIEYDYDQYNSWTHFGYTQDTGSGWTSLMFYNNSDIAIRIPDLGGVYFRDERTGGATRTVACNDDESFWITFYGYGFY